MRVRKSVTSVRSLTVLALLVVLPPLTGCSSQPPTSADTETSAAPEADAGLEDIFSQLDGLDARERLEKLHELAGAEDGEFSIYTSMAREESEPLLEVFEETFDIEPSLVRANGQSLVRRLLEEDSANYVGADAIASNGPEMVILEQEGVLEELQPTDVYGIPEEYLQSPSFLPVYLNIFTAGWNTDLVNDGDVPESWEDVLTHPNGTSLEVSDSAWFGALVTEYLVGRKGMSEEEAIDMVAAAAGTAQVIDGHTLQAQLLSAGEFPLAASLYVHSVRREVDDGAPITFEPAVEPLFSIPQGAGVQRGANRPATALLFIEWLQSQEVQEMLGEFGRTPANPDAAGGVGDLEVINVPQEIYGADAQRWTDAYETVVSGAGGVVSD